MTLRNELNGVECDLNAMCSQLTRDLADLTASHQELQRSAASQASEALEEMTALEDALTAAADARDVAQQALLEERRGRSSLQQSQNEQLEGTQKELDETLARLTAVQAAVKAHRAKEAEDQEHFGFSSWQEMFEAHEEEKAKWSSAESWFESERNAIKDELEAAHEELEQLRHLSKGHDGLSRGSAN